MAPNELSESQAFSLTCGGSGLEFVQNWLERKNVKKKPVNKPIISGNVKLGEKI